ncbi:carbon starvation CstA family protein [Methanimicrococcus blatticola]|uniref:Carbon starvation protein CstA n=1 Tax=Methanimicrococcus blatticola TaxID=91560 RepID=A0A484F5L2_9EURY|nr:carbon starvation protein A [Methanimicrococcus blatticola]MBZ3934979.1 hypothetical protein [Methanimicrococcus blatticola]MCC2508923.1 carbon starvation protein A [Methanimicrococcus blatticola]TDQ71049.1 carbon starvation protein CstA [Methanimicrococcus blatticola]
MNSILLMIGSFLILLAAYVFYGSWLAKKWGVDPTRPTPAHTMTDGVDYIPTKPSVLLGHHFASIAGAGPINGPIQAAIFGWLPVALWVLIGGIFIGAVQDFSSIFASIRHDGKSIGHIIELYLGKTGKKMFLAFAWLTLVLVVAAFADIVGSTFVGFAADGTQIASNATAAATSVYFVFFAILYGFLIHRRNPSPFISIAVAILFIIFSIALGFFLPVYLSKTTWMIVIIIYIFIAAITPVWILLQPRDYLNSFLLYAMIIAAFIGILVTNPVIGLPVFTGWNVNGQWLFPALFITIACGAISGFHSLVGSGTTSKQLNNEKDAKLIGYGGMLIECGLAIIALIAVGALYVNGEMPAGTPPVVFANAIASFVGNIGIPTDIAYVLITLAIASFSLTSLDTATRLGRYMFQEFFSDIEVEGEIRSDCVSERVSKKKTIYAFLSDKYVATAVTIIAGGLLAISGYQNIWPLFGSANQLLAALALMAVAIWLGNIGKNNKMFYIPMLFMFAATLTALAISMYQNFIILYAGNGQLQVNGLQLVVAVFLFILAVILAVQGIQKIWRQRKNAVV